MKIDVYNQKGEKTGNLEVSQSVFGLPWNDNLIHQVAVSMASNLRTPVAHAKGRGDVRGGGKKPWPQKGTGQARHGSRRSPIWVGGGVTHGPVKDKNYSKKINKKMMKKALFTVLSRKAQDGEILILEDLKLEDAKTKKAAEVISSLGKISGFEKLKTKKKNAAGIFIKGKKSDNEVLKKAFRNLPGILVNESRNLNPLDASTNKYLVFTKDALKSLEAKSAK